MFRRSVALLTTVFVAIVCIFAEAGETPTTKPDASWVRIASTWRRPRLVGSASDSGHFQIDEAKLRDLFPGFDWTPDQLAYISDHIDKGDSRAAIVASVKPLVVSAYSDELDGVILVQFPDALVDKYSLKAGDQLIASWIYPSLRKPPGDIVQGTHSSKRYNNGAPLVDDFISASLDEIKQRKSHVTKEEWDRLKSLTPGAIDQVKGRYRSCFPLGVGIPAF